MKIQNKTAACIRVLLGFVALELLSSTVLAAPGSVPSDDVPAVGLDGGLEVGCPFESSVVPV